MPRLFGKDDQGEPSVVIALLDGGLLLCSFAAVFVLTGAAREKTKERLEEPTAECIMYENESLLIGNNETREVCQLSIVEGEWDMECFD